MNGLPAGPWARMERKLLALRENVLAPDDWTGFFSSPAFIMEESPLLIGLIIA